METQLAEPARFNPHSPDDALILATRTAIQIWRSAAYLGLREKTATLHGSSWQGTGVESVMSGIGSATLAGAKGVSSISGGSGLSGASQTLADRGAFSFDTVGVGGKQLIGNFASGTHSIASGLTIGGDQDKHAGSGGQTQIALDHGKTIIHISSTATINR